MEIQYPLLLLLGDSTTTTGETGLLHLATIVIDVPSIAITGIDEVDLVDSMVEEGMSTDLHPGIAEGEVRAGAGPEAEVRRGDVTQVQDGQALLTGKG